MYLLLELCLGFFVSLSTSTQLRNFSGPSLPSYDYGPGESKIRARQQNPSILVTTGATGGQGPNGSPPSRLEVRELRKNNAMWTLYLLGLDRFQKLEQNNLLSWYSIAGIHGRPYQSYNDVQAVPGSENNGYCTHISVLFPTWHRPYLALYEQSLYGLIQDIAQQYPAGTTRDTYTLAAANFRIPYWDWAARPPSGDNVLPSSMVGSPIVDVNGPAGPQTIGNPLHTYNFHPLDPSQFPNDPFNQFLETERYPDSNTASARSQDDVAVGRIESDARNIRSRIYAILTNYHDYLAFSNEGFRSLARPDEQDSLEAIHDQIHGLIGGGGHMSFTDYAGFDPIFFMHHTMVDRCFDLWQALNPDTYVPAIASTMDTFTSSAGQIQDANTPLTPFYKDQNGNFWTSNDVRSTRALGYSYPETANTNGASVQENVIRAINALYGPNAQVMTEGSLTPHSLSASGDYREWVANIQMHKAVHNAPFTVYVFLGPISTDPTSWSSDPNLAGLHTTFVKAMTSDAVCDDCGDSQLVTATIPLTSRLIKVMEQGDCESLRPDDVGPWLEENLTYRISMLNGSQVTAGSVTSLRVSIASANVVLPLEHSDLPVWDEMIEHMEVAAGEMEWYDR
ncbi:hypothetical protein K3495_g3971 [Podosphaera aphanis]|nr:hypothetical protein K3495_g3971 [Podosphaera aphanis]